MWHIDKTFLLHQLLHSNGLVLIPKIKKHGTLLQLSCTTMAFRQSGAGHVLWGCKEEKSRAMRGTGYPLPARWMEARQGWLEVGLNRSLGHPTRFPRPRWISSKTTSPRSLNFRRKKWMKSEGSGKGWRCWFRVWASLFRLTRLLGTSKLEIKSLTKLSLSLWQRTTFSSTLIWGGEGCHPSWWPMDGH